MRTVTQALIVVTLMSLGSGLLPSVLVPSPAQAASSHQLSRSYSPARPATGLIFQAPSFFGGQGQQVIDNTRGDQDAVVVLLGSDNKTAAAWVYLRKGGLFALTGLRDGDYHLYYMVGSGWQRRRWRFKRQVSSQRVTHPDPVSFVTTDTSSTVWTMTLYPSCVEPTPTAINPIPTRTNGCMQSQPTPPLRPPHH